MDSRAVSNAADRLPGFVAAHLATIQTLCAEHAVKRLDLIGSARTDRFDAERSDLDLVVEFDHAMRRRGFRDPYFRLKHAVEDLMNREVDLIERNAIRDPDFKREVESARTCLYAA